MPVENERPIARTETRMQEPISAKYYDHISMAVSITQVFRTKKVRCRFVILGLITASVESKIGLVFHTVRLP